jgi:hypothetical protein
MSLELWSELSIPMMEGKDPVIVRGQFPFSAENWAHMLTVLAAMRPACLAEDDSAVLVTVLE